MTGGGEQRRVPANAPAHAESRQSEVVGLVEADAVEAIPAHEVALVAPGQVERPRQSAIRGPFLAREETGRERARMVVVIDMIGLDAGREATARDHGADVASIVGADLAAEGDDVM